jgi:DNA repair photolyase
MTEKTETEGKKPSENYRYSHSIDYSLSTQLKSWMAINPHIGCVWDCAYCIQHKDKFFSTLGPKQISKLVSVDDTLSEIESNLRITSKTPLTFFNYSDPFLPQNTEELRKILSGLDERKFTNIVGLITRTKADEKTLEMIASLENLRPIVLITYAGYDNANLEGSPVENRINLAKELKKRKIPVLQYLRPLAQEWVEKDQFKKTRIELGDVVDGVVMSGIRITPETANVLEKRNIPVPKVPNATNKYFPKNLQEEILEAYNNSCPVYRYTSCAVSATLNIPDYNSHLGFFRETQEQAYVKCPLPCKKGQSEICSGCCSPDNTTIKKLLETIQKKDVEFSITNKGSVILEENLSKYDMTFLRHNTSAHVDYKGNKHYVDKVANIEVKSQK